MMNVFEDFAESKERKNGKKLPSILYVLTDEGDGGSPTNRKLQVYAEFLKYDFDVDIIASYGPYISRMNPVERAMAVLNRILAGENDILAKYAKTSEVLMQMKNHWTKILLMIFMHAEPYVLAN